MIFRPVLGLAALALIVGGCASPPGSGFAKKACQEWQRIDAHLGTGTFDENLWIAADGYSNQAERANVRYTGLRDDIASWGIEPTDDKVSAIDRDCASI